MPHARNHVSDSIKQILLAGLFLATAATIYSGLLYQPWSYDDEPHVAKAAEVLNTPSNLLDRTSKEPLRFVSHLYFLIVYSLTDASSSSYHLGNILLHLLNSWLLIRAVRRVVDSRIAVATGFLFLINMAGYEAVYSIAASATLLGTFFALLAVERSAAYFQTQSTWAWMTASASFLACLLSYESHVSVLLPLCGLIAAHHGIRPESRRLSLSLLGCLLLVWLIDSFVFQTSESKVSFNQIALGTHIFSNFGFFFARLILCAYITPTGWGGPFPYDIPPDHWQTFGWYGWVIFFVCLGFSVRDKRIRIATVWMTATILPYLLSTDHMYFTRYWYLPAAGASLLYAMILGAVTDRLRSPARLPATLSILAVTSYFAMGKAHIFEGRYLFHAANYYLAHRHEPHQAEEYYTRVINDYGYATGMVYSQLGAAQVRGGEITAAIASFRKAISVAPAYGVGYLNLGVSLYQQGNINEAIDNFARAIAIDRSRAELLAGLGEDLMRQERWDLAARVWRIACEAWPGDANPPAYLGISLFRSGKTSEAQESFGQALRISTDNTTALFGLGLLYKRSGNTSEAIHLYRKCLAIAPDNDEVRIHLAELIADLKVDP